MSTIKKLLVANRGEIAIRVCRTAHELGIRTVAIYSHEDRYALHRFKADEAYMVGKPGEPIRCYLDIPNIIRIAREHGVDAIHPGYGFLSEKPEFARACAEAGITFVGPTVEMLEQLGDKTAARFLADKAKVPIIGGSKKSIVEVADGLKTARQIGFPVILKAAHGGGGRGMRVVEKEAAFADAYEAARRESLTAFGSPDIFVEKFISRARHIEVQLMGDAHGNLIHLFERDCSVQRRHQKVVELAPAPNLDENVRRQILDAALRIGRAVNYRNAGTVEFLVDDDTGEYYFIEVNPRIQVEHTVTEEVTGVDIVKTQILVASGLALTHPDVGLGDLSAIRPNGYAIQCRITTEDPANGFRPDHGRLTHYRSTGGMGIRLDAGTAFSGALVTPYYDSMLVKATARGTRFEDAIRHMERALQEFRIRGVKTNLPFLQKLIDHPTFRAGKCTTRFIDQTPELFQFSERQDRATRLLTFMAETIVNGNPLVADLPVATRRSPAQKPDISPLDPAPRGTRDLFKEMGAEKFCKWVLAQKGLLFTDTTMRDAHQSLLATRLRTHEMTLIAPAYRQLLPQLFSMEMWGGATFDTSMRFLKEDPWQRLAEMRELVPNILFQMLLRASSAVGYANYPDNVVKAFVKEAANAGMDVFRIFDALNWTPNMKVAMEAAIKHGGLCEACICYTGDILNPRRPKYDLKYYVKMAKELERMGAHILGIKDMAGLCKPEAARRLVKALKDEIGIPVHFHTHDTAGLQSAAVLNAAEAGLDIADAAMAAFSGGTSQPNLNTLVEALRFSRRASGLDVGSLDAIAEYWREAREYYKPFEGDPLPGTGDLYHHEMPGGQYTNLFQQARSLGLSEKWPQICSMYADVNQLFGDIVKVTPSSKAVGDMALFLVANNLTCRDVLDENRQLAYPASVVELIGGMMGKPPGGFPPKVVKQILRGEKPMKGRPGAVLPPADFASAEARVRKLTRRREVGPRDVLSQILYPKVHDEYLRHEAAYSDVSALPTPVFFYGLAQGEEISLDIEKGKTLIIKYVTKSAPHIDGKRTVFFELNGIPREVTVQDKSIKAAADANVKADPENKKHVGASMPGMVISLAVSEGSLITKGQKLLVLEAMKMETTVYAEAEGKVARVRVKAGAAVEAGDLILELE